MADSAVLLEDVKNYLDITFVDENSDKKLTGIVERGMRYLQELAGSTALGFEEEGQARALLLDYCRYARSNALEAFPVNFRAELLALRIAREVAEYADESPAEV